MLQSKRTKPSKQKRKGAAVVEFAVCLPVIVLVVLGSIESASMLFLRQATIQSSYEGARVAIKRGGTNAAARQAIEAVARGRRIEDLDIQFEPSDVSAVDPGTPITVTVSAPGDANSFIPFGPFQGITVSGKAVMVKE